MTYWWYGILAPKWAKMTSIGILQHHIGQCIFQSTFPLLQNVCKAHLCPLHRLFHEFEPQCYPKARYWFCDIFSATKCAKMTTIGLAPHCCPGVSYHFLYIMERWKCLALPIPDLPKGVSIMISPQCTHYNATPRHPNASMTYFQQQNVPKWQSRAHSSTSFLSGCFIPISIPYWKIAKPRYSHFWASQRHMDHITPRHPNTGMVFQIPTEPKWLPYEYDSTSYLKGCFKLYQIL